MFYSWLITSKTYAGRLPGQCVSSGYLDLLRCVGCISKNLITGSIFLFPFAPIMPKIRTFLQCEGNPASFRYIYVTLPKIAAYYSLESLQTGNKPNIGQPFAFLQQHASLVHTIFFLISPQSLKLIIDPLVASFIPVTNAFIVLAIVISFCACYPKPLITNII